jgi:hypothetical protein
MPPTRISVETMGYENFLLNVIVKYVKQLYSFFSGKISRSNARRNVLKEKSLRGYSPRFIWLLKKRKLALHVQEKNRYGQN